MAVIPVNLARVSQNLRSFNLLASIRRNTTGLFNVQNQLATGLKVNRPSDEPTLAAAAGEVDRRLELMQQVERNLLNANNVLTQCESAMLDAVELIMDIQTVASETVSDTSSTDERAALARVVDSTLDQLVSVGNRSYLNAYLFGGHYSGSQPFELTADGVLYHGDAGQAYSIVDTDLSQDTFTFSGVEFFNAVSQGVQGAVDLDPALTRETRISELRGTTGEGVTLRQIVVSDGTQETTIDLGGCDTVGDLLDKLNDEMPASLQAALGAQSIAITSALAGPAQITVRDVAGGQTARDLGLTADGLAVAGGGDDLDPRLTLRTELTDLNAGTGLSLANGLTIRNGTRSATLDFTGAETLEDILNKINQADVGAWARVSADGRSIEVVNRMSGSSLTIEENGGQLATALGIRSLHGGTELASLNNGLGIDTVDGNDLRVVTADGSTFEIDLDSAETLQDVIDLLNAAGGGAITAGLTAQGNGLSLTDNTVGPGTMRFERANLSPALDGLGLSQDDSGTTLVGQDVNPIRTESPFTALVELRNALRADDRQGIAQAGERLENALQRIQEVQGQMASQAKAMEERNQLVESEVLGARVLLSDIRDVDMTEVIVRFQQMQNALQANLSTSSQVMNMSLINYLR